jgi:hypothetical protein
MNGDDTIEAPVNESVTLTAEHQRQVALALNDIVSRHPEEIETVNRIRVVIQGGESEA